MGLGQALAGGFGMTRLPEVGGVLPVVGLAQEEIEHGGAGVEETEDHATREREEQEHPRGMEDSGVRRDVGKTIGGFRRQDPSHGERHRRGCEGGTDDREQQQLGVEHDGVEHESHRATQDIREGPLEGVDGVGSFAHDGGDEERETKDVAEHHQDGGKRQNKHDGEADRDRATDDRRGGRREPDGVEESGKEAHGEDGQGKRGGRGSHFGERQRNGTTGGKASADGKLGRRRTGDGTTNERPGDETEGDGRRRACGLFDDDDGGQIEDEVPQGLGGGQEVEASNRIKETVNDRGSEFGGTLRGRGPIGKPHGGEGGGGPERQDEDEAEDDTSRPQREGERLEQTRPDQPTPRAGMKDETGLFRK